MKVTVMWRVFDLVEDTEVHVTQCEERNKSRGKQFIPVGFEPDVIGILHQMGGPIFGAVWG